jgi:DNA uptake protein ComE-like DNA-binding protein
MTTLPTVEIDRGGHKLIINAADFNPDADKLWGQKTTPKGEPDGVQKEEEASQGQVITAHDAILALINQATKVYELEPIPTVGKAAAAAILENRPEGGYQSLDDLAPILPPRTSLEAIKGWGGPEP